MKPDPRPAVEVSVRVTARPATVWRCLTQRDLLSRWLAADVELEPRVGAPVTIRFDRYRTRVEGAVVEVVPERRLGFTWGVAEGAQRDSMPPGSTRVTITLAPDGPGTLVVLRHEGLPSEQERRDHRGGWQAYVAALGAVACCLPALGSPEALADAWLEAWAETAPERGAALLRATASETVAFRDAHADLQGREALLAWIRDCQARFPGVRMRREGPVLGARASLLVRWQARAGDGPVVARGVTRLRLDAEGLADEVEGFWEP